METTNGKNFIHLNCHSDYSFFRSKARILDLVKSASSLGMPALALTDIGNMYGALEFYRACKKENIKPIIGTEVVYDSLQWLDRFILLARNETGYKNLTRLYNGNTKVDPFGANKINFDHLFANTSGLICIVTVLDFKFTDRWNPLLELQSNFDADCVYLGLQNYGESNKIAQLREIIELSKKINLPLVALNCGMYGYEYNYDASDGKLRAQEEVAKLFSACPEAISNTVRIGDMINLELNLSGSTAPAWASFDMSITPVEYLRQLVMEL